MLRKTLTFARMLITGPTMNARRSACHLRRCSKKACLVSVIVLCAGTNTYGDIIIDDFTTGGPFSETLVPTDRFLNYSKTGLDPTHTIGGERHIVFDSCVISGTMPVDHDPAAGIWDFGGTPGSRFCEGPSFLYGNTWASWLPENPLNLDLISAGVTGVRVTFDFLDPGQPNTWYHPVTDPSYVDVTLYSGESADDRSVVSSLLPVTSSRVSVDLPLSSLAPEEDADAGVDLASIVGIHVWFGGLGDGSHLIVSELALITGLNGDLNGDGFVGIDDLTTVLGNWNQSVPPGDPAADPSGDGFVGIDDLNLILGNWNAGTPPTNTSPVPEPATGFVLGAACVCLLKRRP